MAQQTRSSEKTDDLRDPRPIRGAPLEPIRVVERELTRPDGTKLKVEVPVYPPFRLAEDPEPESRSQGESDEDSKATKR